MLEIMSEIEDEVIEIFAKANILNVDKNQPNRFLSEDGTYKEPIVVDKEINENSTNVVENQAIAKAIKGKQDKLTPGKNITIQDGVISADNSGVEVNPTEDATEDLSKLKVGETVYDVVDKTQLEEELAKKVTKPATPGDKSLLVHNPDGTVSNVLIGSWSSGALKGRIPAYVNAENANKAIPSGILMTGTPVYEGHAANKKYVDDKFNGANKAVSFVNYSSMIASLNALASTNYNVGQNIMIVTLEVPDLWVSEITETSIPYTYVSDDDFVSELKTNGFVQVGYFKLSALETQKVDLEDYAKKEDLDTKLDKKTKNTHFVYGYFAGSGGMQTTYNLGTNYANVNNGTIAQYFGEAQASIGERAPKAGTGFMYCAEPISPYFAAPKKYVDDNKGSKLWKHTLTFDFGFGENRIFFYSTKSTPIVQRGSYALFIDQEGTESITSNIYSISEAGTGSINSFEYNDSGFDYGLTMTLPEDIISLNEVATEV
jgi:hypothetical protein